MSKSWWLYSGDIEEAISNQWKRIQTAKTGNEKAIEASVLTYLGQYEECERFIVENKLNKFVEGRQALFRARRAQRSKYAWSSLVDEAEQFERLDMIIKKAIKNGYVVCISLVGGIGDQIESASIILNEDKNYVKGERPKLMIRSRGSNNKIVENYLYTTRARHLLAKKNDNFMIEIPMPMYRAWLESRRESIRGYEYLRKTVKRRQKDDEKNLLLCLRSKTNQKNPLSFFGRSLRFQEIMTTLEKINTVDQLRIRDISEYNIKEKEIIKKETPRVELIRDSINTLEDTNSYIEAADCIITVDTSIAHISATSGVKNNLLLAKYPDERWIELMSQEKAYKDTTKIKQQQEFGKWTNIEATIYEIVASLR